MHFFNWLQRFDAIYQPQYDCHIESDSERNNVSIKIGFKDEQSIFVNSESFGRDNLDRIFQEGSFRKDQSKRIICTIGSLGWVSYGWDLLGRIFWTGFFWIGSFGQDLFGKEQSKRIICTTGSLGQVLLEGSFRQDILDRIFWKGSFRQNHLDAIICCSIICYWTLSCEFTRSFSTAKASVGLPSFYKPFLVRSFKQTSS